VLMPSTA